MNKTNCNICPRNCQVDKKSTAGFCGATNQLKVSKVMLHHWEEPIISGKNGSGAIFFSHCNLKCIFCQNYEISSGGYGKEISIETLVSIFKQLEEAKAHNINLVSPTQYSEQIIEALKTYKPSIPIVWNSNGYESVETIKKLNGLVDIYLCDFKYYNNDLATEFSNAPNYFETCTKVLKEMFKQQPKNIIKDGLLKNGIIIRHLVLPNYSNDSIKILDHIKENFGTKTIISLMSQYLPYFKAINHKTLGRKLKPIEYKRVLTHFEKLNFENGFCQELTSADECFIPDFNKQDIEFCF